MKNRVTIINKSIIRLVRKGIAHYRVYGFKSAVKRTFEVLGYRRNLFRSYMKKPLYSEAELEEQRHNVFPQKVTFSIITPLYNTEKAFLHDMLDSVIAQTYSEWELCLADGSDNEHSYVGDICREYSEKDSRIRYKKLKENKGIVGNSNEAIMMATGDYISLLDHDDILHPAALLDVMKAICNEDADFIYTDEATFKSPNIRKIVIIHFKPDFAPDNLLANNYICHFTSFRRDLLDLCGGAFREGYEGSQDHELVLRLTSKAQCIVHIPEVLYYWRSCKGSTAASVNNKSYCSEAGMKAVKDYLESSGIKASVQTAGNIPTIYRINYELKTPLPKISIIIPNYEHIDDLRKCISSILDKTTWPDYEVIIVENNSSSPEIFEYYEKIQTEHNNIKVVVHNVKFNWSVLNNFGIREARGDYCLLLNNDTEVINSDWLEEMMMYEQRPDVGIVGAMLYYPDDTIQHAGVIVGLGGVAGHAFSGTVRGGYGYMGRLCYAQNMTAVTGACMLIKRSVWQEVGGFEEDMTNDYNDIDFCMRVRAANYLIVWTPYAELYHSESKSRGLNDDPWKRESFRHDGDVFRERWKVQLDAGDPYYNPHFTLRRSDFSLKKSNERKASDYYNETWG